MAREFHGSAAHGGARRARRSLALAAAGMLGLSSAEASAETCAPAGVTARGEPARYEWLAKTKARANWRRRVRETTSLGTDYANWALARETTERCLSGPSGVVCIFTGTPCSGK